MTIYDRIKALREQQGLTQQQLAEMVGYKTASAINKIELGLRDISQSKILGFATALNTTPCYLLGGEERLFHNADNMVALPSRKPRLGTLADGEPLLSEKNIIQYDYAPDDIDCDFTVMCIDNGLNDRWLSKGDIVFVSQHNDVVSGEVAAVRAGNEIYIRSCLKRTNDTVFATNVPGYSPIYLNEQTKNDVEVLGRAVAFISTIGDKPTVSALDRGILRVADNKTPSTPQEAAALRQRKQELQEQMENSKNSWKKE